MQYITIDLFRMIERIRLGMLMLNCRIGPSCCSANHNLHIGLVALSLHLIRLALSHWLAVPVPPEAVILLDVSSESELRQSLLV